MSLFTHGQKVTDQRGMFGRITGVGNMEYDGKGSDQEIYLVDFGDDPDHPTDQRLVYGDDLESMTPELTTITYRFTSNVEGTDHVDRESRLADALVEALTWDGDDDAPPELEELQMQRIDE